MSRTPVKWTKKLLARLGPESDASVAKRMGVSPPTVGTKRRALGIAKFAPL
jgi:hypothetical protein